MNAIRILVVTEDEPDFNNIENQFAKLPHSNNYILSWCNSYEKAINSMLKSQYGIYLVYHSLGKYTGVDLLNEAIKSNVAEPVILVTGNEDYSTDDDAMQKGAAAYFIQGKLDVSSLERSIRYAVHHNKNLQEIKDSENKFRIIFEKSPDPILITDIAGNIHDINKAGEKFFGLPRLQILKTNANRLYKNLADRITFISEIEQKGVINNFLVDLVAADNEIKQCSVSSFVQISQHGDNELFHSVIHDLTQLKADLHKNEMVALRQ
jgi:PAS domain S-box-containing protein